MQARVRGIWGSQLYTISAALTKYRIGFRFQNSVALHEVELYIFFCPAWDIGAATITISIIPYLHSARECWYSVTLTSAMVDRVSLTRINIPIQVTMGIVHPITSLSSHLQWDLEESILVR